MRTIALTILALLLLATSASAYPVGCRSWSFVMAGGPRGNVGTAEGSADGLDTGDQAVFLHGGWYAGSSRTFGVDGWDGLSGFYATDKRAPLTVGQSRVWDIYVWAKPGTTATANPSFSFADGAPYDPNVLISVECIHVPAGVNGGPAVGTVWTEAGIWIPVPYYATDDPLTSYGFRFVATMVPEPATGLSVAGMMLCILGTASRRKR